jgi:hypothetical protein
MCHWFFPDTPVRVSSFGGLQHFRKSGKPAEAGDATRCLDCAYETQCPYSAKRGEFSFPRLLSHWSTRSESRGDSTFVSLFGQGCHRSNWLAGSSPRRRNPGYREHHRSARSWTLREMRIRERQRRLRQPGMYDRSLSDSDCTILYTHRITFERTPTEKT